jgi:hypothetical protein
MMAKISTTEAMIHNPLMPFGWKCSHIAAQRDDTRPPICKKKEDTESSDARFSDGMILFSSVCSATEPIASMRYIPPYQMMKEIGPVLNVRVISAAASSTRRRITVRGIHLFIRPSSFPDTSDPTRAPANPMNAITPSKIDAVSSDVVTANRRGCQYFSTAERRNPNAKATASRAVRELFVRTVERRFFDVS